MTFTIRFNRTEKEIAVSNKTAYLMLNVEQLKELGFEGSDLWGTEKYRLYNGTLEQALETDYEGEKDKDAEARTNLWMSLWLRKIFADLHLRYDIPMYLLTSRTIRLGSAIIEKKYAEKFKRLNYLWGEIRWVNNIVAQQLEAQEYIVNGLANAKRTFIRMPEWCSNMLGGVTGAMRTEKAGLIRLAMYHAISRSEKAISKKNKEYVQKEIAKFDKQIDDSIEFLEVNVNHFTGVWEEEQDD